MMRFVMREQIVAKVGAQEGVGSAGADLWNMPLSMKRETGNIFTRLRIVDKKSDGTGRLRHPHAPYPQTRGRLPA